MNANKRAKHKQGLKKKKILWRWKRWGNIWAE